jgi:hypothetical protein
MSVNLYRLYAVQSFNGKKVAVYVCEGNYPDADILNDAIDLVEDNRTRKEILANREWTYGKCNNLSEYQSNRNKLNHYARKLRHSKKVMDKSGPVSTAIFVNKSIPVTWRGEHTLYENKVFDMIKADTPVYSACTPIGIINI